MNGEIFLEMVLLDTCALLWWTLDPGKLSDEAAGTCDLIPITGGAISSISIWEIGIKIKKGKIEIPLTLDEYVSRLNLLGSLEIIPVDESIWIENISLEWDHKDPADRTIVATARLKNLPIITKDNVIKIFYPNVIW
jgi:PIN domain nuclease of toxin-antitoxin system